MEILEFTEPVGNAVVIDDVPEAPCPEVARKKSKRSRGSIVKIPTKTISDCLDCEGQRNDKLRVLAIKLHNEEIVLNNRRLRKQWKVSNRRFKSGVRAMREDGDLERDTNGGNAADGEARYAAEELILDRSGSWSAIPTKLLKGETNDLCYFAAVSLSPKAQKAIDVAKRIGVSSPTTVRAMVARLAPSSVKGAADDVSSEDDYIQVFNGPHGVKMVARLGVQVAKNVPDRIVLDRIVPTQRRWKKSKKMNLKTNKSTPPAATRGGVLKNDLEVKAEASRSSPHRTRTAATEAKFAEFWAAYPGKSPANGGRKCDEARVRKLFTVITTGAHTTLTATADDLVARARGYAKAKATAKPEHIRAPLNWLQGEEWKFFDALPPPPPPPWFADEAQLAAMTPESWTALIRDKAASGVWRWRDLGYDPHDRRRIVPDSVIESMNLRKIFGQHGLAVDDYAFNGDGTRRENVFAPLPPPPPAKPIHHFEPGECVIPNPPRWPFKPGDRVRHYRGLGIVTSLPRNTGLYDTIAVQFDDGHFRDNCLCKHLTLISEDNAA